MNNTINRIKVFFKGKPTRIIIALLVIAANVLLQAPSTFTGPTQHRSTC